jgi:hypothetical protein
VVVKIVKNKGIKYWKRTICFTHRNCVKDGNGKLFLEKIIRNTAARKRPKEAPGVLVFL